MAKGEWYKTLVWVVEYLQVVTGSDEEIKVTHFVSGLAGAWGEWEFNQNRVFKCVADLAAVVSILQPVASVPILLLSTVKVHLGLFRM